MKQKTLSPTSTFKSDVIKGLLAEPKYFDSKYLYDEAGDKLFQQIMASPEYYLTKAELEIFSTHCKDMLNLLIQFAHGIDLIELGAGDALKSQQLLKCLSDAEISFTYYPIDISKNIIQLLETQLPGKIKGIAMKGIQSDYLTGLKTATSISQRPRLVLFLGGNIGNMPPIEAEQFLVHIFNQLEIDDLLLVGFDLKKNPWTVFNAYNDSQGITKAFNLNLLERLNRELGADFKLDQFDHFENYDPESGACKSYIISLVDQRVQIEGQQFIFKENECVFTETSQKYSLDEISLLAKKVGFSEVINLFDTQKRFVDVIWRKT